MTRIRLTAEAQAEQVMATVRETVESRDYLWERTDPVTAIASKPVINLAVGVSQRLRVGIRFDDARHRLVLRHETPGAADIANGGPISYVRLAARLRKLVRAVREDLAAAALR